MEVRAFLDVLHLAERLKDELRHCETSKGRRESVAEHSWRMTLMAFFMQDEFPDVDIDRVIKMCMIHDLGECFTGDIPSFLKTKDDEQKEQTALEGWVEALPQPYARQLSELYAEMDALQTPEAKLYKAIDKLEAVIQHNESDLRSWEPQEYELNRTYANDVVKGSEYLTALRAVMREDTEEKIAKGIQ